MQMESDISSHVNIKITLKSVIRPQQQNIEHSKAARNSPNFSYCCSLINWYSQTFLLENKEKKLVLFPVLPEVASSSVQRALRLD